MSEKYLQRKDVPFSEKVWEKIDETVTSAAKSQLSGRRLISIQGPYGLGVKSVSSGDRPVEEKTVGDTQMSVSCIMPLVMIRKGFTIPIRDIAAFEESGMPLELSGAAEAAINCAKQEDNLIFNGSKTLGVNGLLNSKEIQSMKLKSWDNIGTAADDIIQAVTALDKSGFHGPYTLGLSPEFYNLLFRRYPQGEQTELEHIRQIITDGIIKVPAIPAGGILLCGGGPFVSIVIGQDLMTGFVGPSENEYEFTIFETVALRLLVPDALCILKK